MKRIITVTLGILAITLSWTPSIQAQDCDSQCMRDQIDTYFANLDQVFRTGSDISDIDTLLSKLHDNVRYMHLEYEADFDKSTWRKAFIRQLNNDSYDNSENEQARIHNVIYGKTHVAIEYSNDTLQEDGTWQQGMNKLALFGFTDGKISLIREYW